MPTTIPSACTSTSTTVSATIPHLAHDRKLGDAMGKRKRIGSFGEEQAQPTKRSRMAKYDLMNFTDEILLRILSFLEVDDLTLVQRCSRRLQRLSTDSSIWRKQYYDRWVQPRVRRLPDSGHENSSLRYSSKLARWLSHNDMLREDNHFNWKRQYKIRTNWWRGKCRMQEVDLVPASEPPILVKICKGIIVTADAEHGLRVWSRNLQHEALATRVFADSSACRNPTALAVDSAQAHELRLMLGFSDGSFEVLSYSAREGIRTIHSQASLKQLSVSACAISFPYILTISDARLVSLYHLSSVEPAGANSVYQCDLLTSLRSETVYSPVSLSIRSNSGGLVACIAYAFFRLNIGWSLGLQELRLSGQGKLLDCRLISADERGERGGNYTPVLSENSTATRSAISQTFALHPNLMNRPSSISYSHPYLTASLPDNTLVVYLVNSKAARLEINTGRRLWGHTSSVSGVEVDHRGKAVSISTKGNEIRVWEFEDVLTSNSLKRSSVRINPIQDLNLITDAIAKRGNGLGLAVRGPLDELGITRNWVGFDDEQVVVLGEESNKRQILSCYDFT